MVNRYGTFLRQLRRLPRRLSKRSPRKVAPQHAPGFTSKPAVNTGELFVDLGGRAWTSYRTAAVERPLITSCFTAGFMYGLGDCMAQWIEHWMGIERTGKTGYNWKRSGRMVLFGFVIAGPILGKWYPVLHKMTSSYRARYKPVFELGTFKFLYRKVSYREPSERAVEAAMKVMCDNLFFQPPFITLYLFSMGILEGRSFAEIYESARQNFHDVWGYGFLLWVPAQSINFWLVPVPLQAFFVNCVNCVWKIIMSLIYHTRDYGAAAKKSKEHLYVIEGLETEMTQLQTQLELQAATIQGQELTIQQQRVEIQKLIQCLPATLRPASGSSKEQLVSA